MMWWGVLLQITEVVRVKIVFTMKTNLTPTLSHHLLYRYTEVLRAV